jgi:hypothetical protein
MAKMTHAAPARLRKRTVVTWPAAPLCALLSLLALSCQAAHTATETIVVIDADSAVRELTANLHTLVDSTDGTSRFESEDPPQWPVHLALVPLAGDARREFRVSVEAKDADGAVLVSARLISGYVANRKLYVSLWLSQSCLKHTPECDEKATCRAGECVPARVLPMELAKTACEQVDASPPNACPPPGDPPPMMVACNSGYADCNGKSDDGCEADLSQNEHCGSCDNACSARRTCSAGICSCPEGTHDCNGECVSNGAASSCGASCTPCPVPAHASAVCTAGRCDISCDSGYSACGGHCLTSFTDDDNCGSCGNACGADQGCQDGKCVACKVGDACEFSECRNGQVQCDGAMRCVAAGAVSDGMACGDGANCQAGHCTCGLKSGSTARWYACASDSDCTPGDVCVDSSGNGMLFCKPLCDSAADCEPFLKDLPMLKCVAPRCSNGRTPGIHFCGEPDSVLAPAYAASGCCLGAGPGTPSSAGCADGTREAFTDTIAHPDIAGCAASWPLSSLRAAKTGHACGNGLGPCTVPADACGTGWHVCAAPPYGPGDIAGKVTASECEAPMGAFAAAVGDQSCEPCTTDVDFSAACCGTRCGTPRSNSSCLFTSKTRWFPDPNTSGPEINRCAAIVTSASDAGVLCCRGY